MRPSIAFHVLRPGRRAALSMLALLLLVTAPALARAVEVQRVVSPGGIEAWLIQNDSIPVISVDLRFDGGTALDPEGLEGLANLTTRLLDEGAGALDSQAFQAALADDAITLGFSAGTDGVTGHLKTVTANADRAFELLRLALTEPRFDAEPVERMKAAVLADIRRRVADPGWQIRRALYDRVFDGHPYGRPSRGTAATLAAITPDDMRGFLDRRFGLDGLTIGVAGDIGPEELGRRLDAVFGTLPQEVAPIALDTVDNRAAGETVLVRRPGAQSEVLIVQDAIGRESPDYYAALVMNHILGGGGFTSRLTGEIREARGLSYGIYSFLADRDYADQLVVGSAMSNDNVPIALPAIEAVFEAMATEGVTAAELEDAQLYMTGSFPLNLTSTDNLSALLVTMQVEDLGIDYIDTRADRITAVTLDEVNAMAARLLDPDAWALGVAGDPPAGAIDPDVVFTAEEIAARELADGS